MILDDKGNVVKPVDKRVCPQCGSRPKDHETYQLFGGVWKRLCKLCAYELATGTGDAPASFEEDS